jgi:uncharacterized protein (DUF58 family)
MPLLQPTARLPRIRVLAGGHLVIGITILLGVAAVQSGLNLLHALVALLLAFQVVSGMRSFVVLRKIEVEAVAPAHVDAGGEAALEIVVRNRKRRLAAHSIEVDVVVRGEGPVAVGPAWLGRIAPRAEARVSLPVRGLARGVARLVEVRVSTSWPCDLFRRVMRYPLDAEVLVRPRRIEASPRDRAGHEEARGRARLATRGGGEIRGLRPFRDGDSPRAIHWKTTARVGRWMVREDETTRPAAWVVVWAPEVPLANEPEDGFPRAVRARLDAEAAVVAAILRRAVALSRRAELRLSGAAAPIVVSHRRGLGGALDALARFTPTGSPPPGGPARARVFLVGDAASPPAGAVSCERAPFAWVPPETVPAETVA